MLSEKASCFLSNLILSFWSSNTKNCRKRCKQDKMSLFVFSVFVKWIAQPKMWADLEKFSFVSLAQQWIHCSKWVPSEWVQTADKTSQSSISNRLHHLTSCEAKSCVFVRNKSIIKTFGLQTLFQLKYESSHLISIAFSSEMLSHLNQDGNMHRSGTVYKQKQATTALNKYFGWFWFSKDNRRWTFLLKEALLWIMHS